MTKKTFAQDKTQGQEEQALTRERYDLIKGIKEWKRLNSIGHLGETYCHFRETKIKDAENRVEDVRT